LPGAKTPDRGKSRLKEAAEKVREEHFEPSINADEGPIKRFFSIRVYLC
jgi:hypothetical protein